MKVGNDGHDAEGDVTLVAAGTVDNIITVWDLESAQILLSLPGHSSFIHVLDFTEDDSFLLSGSADETVMIWSLESLYRAEQQSSVYEEDFSSLSLGPVFDAKFLPTTKGYSGHRGELEREIVRIVAPDDANCLRILDDGVPLFRSSSEEGNMIR